jgi:hypothetical protein
VARWSGEIGLSRGVCGWGRSARPPLDATLVGGQQGRFNREGLFLLVIQ